MLIIGQGAIAYRSGTASNNVIIGQEGYRFFN